MINTDLNESTKLLNIQSEDKIQDTITTPKTSRFKSQKVDEASLKIENEILANNNSTAKSLLNVITQTPILQNKKSSLDLHESWNSNSSNIDINNNNNNISSEANSSTDTNSELNKTTASHGYILKITTIRFHFFLIFSILKEMKKIKIR
jgi:hypothetical protein